MDAEADIAAVAALVANRARALMLDVLMDGEPHAASELALRAGVAASTASGHLAELVAGGVILADRKGRQRTFRIARPDVAAALEALAAIAPPRPAHSLRESNSNKALREARTCYDHLAGRLGVALTDALVGQGILIRRSERFELSQAGERRLTEVGVDVAAARYQRRAFARVCMDWSERRPHLAGALGAALCERLVKLGWVRHRSQSRAVTVTRPGIEGLYNIIALDYN